jgi:hypothetical protein
MRPPPKPGGRAGLGRGGRVFANGRTAFVDRPPPQPVVRDAERLPDRRVRDRGQPGRRGARADDGGLGLRADGLLGPELDQDQVRSAPCWHVMLSPSSRVQPSYRSPYDKRTRLSDRGKLERAGVQGGRALASPGRLPAPPQRLLQRGLITLGLLAPPFAPTGTSTCPAATPTSRSSSRRGPRASRLARFRTAARLL